MRAVFARAFANSSVTLLDLAIVDNAKAAGRALLHTTRTKMMIRVALVSSCNGA